MFFGVLLFVLGVFCYFFFKAAHDSLFKSSCINTFYYFSSSTNNIEFRKVCKFYHNKYKDGSHQICIEMSDSKPMQFNLLSVPTEVGKALMFELSTIDNKITNIELMMFENTAFVTFPNGTIFNFRGYNS